MKQDITTLKAYFETGNIPTQAEFADFIDSTKTGLNEVIIQDVTELPTAVAGVITLVAGNHYKTRNNATIALGTDRVDPNGALISGELFAESAVWTYTGTGNMFTSTNVNFICDSMTFNCTSGTFIDYNDNFTKRILLNNVTVNSANTGDLDSYGLWQFNECVFNSTSTGLTLQGTTGTPLNGATLGKSLFTGLAGAGTYIDFGTSDSQFVTMMEMRANIATDQSFITGTADAANFDSGIKIRESDFVLTGTGAVLAGGINQHDIKSDFRDNFGLENSKSKAGSYISASASTTVGVGDGDLGNPKKIAGTYTSDNAQRFDVTTTAGRWIFKGKQTENFRISIDCSIDLDSGNNVTIIVYLAVNGSTNVFRSARRKFKSGDIGALSINTNLSLNTDDYVEVWGENISGTENYTLENGSINID